MIEYGIAQFDRFLKTVIPNSASAAKANPAQQAPHDIEMDEGSRQHAAGLMRINHTGEVCAQALYNGQALTAKSAEARAYLEHAADEETDHLVWCEERLAELASRPSLLNPAFYGASFAIGAMTGLLGDRISLGFVSATEDQVCKHLEEHMVTLPEEDQRSRAILQQMIEDEERHGSEALARGGKAFPSPVKQLMTVMSKVMTTTTYRI
ncbi:2-polyprenyl-3-methyl-6-methoxy-1,4-benzoquinone monooxygenase [Salinibius halmophilus]|uniref:2-polyprenyl-3-methyl-6-methoxy-1,4-benzoquinone monooxygenase n=1 Tax=Salinibius halmophilus TaxID=1853216 RepID=UPI000E661252|nr:2-polyprenyl-3-methyl-6-methoxy-1,4-benzoquinone monooxygenase [Salinibius halmophilus]